MYTEVIRQSDMVSSSLDFNLSLDTEGRPGVELRQLSHSGLSLPYSQNVGLISSPGHPRGIIDSYKRR